MKKTILAAVALVALASCAKENSATETIDPIAPVAATFASASITRVANNAWEKDNKIGITMVENGSFTPVAIDGSNPTAYYYNIPYTVDAAGDSGTFSADGTVIYFPVDNSSKVDFYAYYPHSDAVVSGTNTLAVDVSSQIFSTIDIVAAKVTGKDKTTPTVSFSGDYAFTHQLSKLTLTIIAGDGVASLEDVTTTINGQPTTTTYNIYDNGIGSLGGVEEMVTSTTSYGTDGADNPDYSVAYTSAILIPTTGTASSTIVFKTKSDGNEYIWNTSNIELTQGKEHNYTITLTKTGVKVDGATIGEWGTGIGGNVSAGDSGTTVAAASAATALSAYGTSTPSVVVQWTLPAEDNSIAGVKIYYSETSGADLSTCAYVDIPGNTTKMCTLTYSDNGIMNGYTYYITLATYNSAGDETYYPTEVSATPRTDF